jgi:hypothetical protein
MFVPLALPPNPPSAYEAQAPISPSPLYRVEMPWAWEWAWEVSRGVTRGPVPNPPSLLVHRRTVVPKLASQAPLPPPNMPSALNPSSGYQTAPRMNAPTAGPESLSRL